MTDSDSQAATSPALAETFLGILESLVGKTITMANPESLEDAPMGQHLTTGFYRAKILSVGKDYICVATEYQRRGREKIKEPVKQFIPIAAVKRISLMKTGAFIHI